MSNCLHSLLQLLILNHLTFLTTRSMLVSDFVTVTKSSFAVTEETIQGIVNQQVLLPCKFITPSEPSDPPHVIWQKNKMTITYDHKKVTNDERISIVTASLNSQNRFDLQISRLKESDAGHYRCVASYSGKMYTKDVTLVVKVPPKINIPKSSFDTTVIEGSSLTLRCVATGVPIPNIKWYKKVSLHNIESWNKEKIDIGSNMEYKIENVSRECQGTYICVANNGIDPSDSHEVKVNVEFRPRVSVVNRELKQSKGMMTMLQCRITSNPIQNYWWEFRGHKFRFTGPDSCVMDFSQKYCVDFKAPKDVPHIVQLDITIKNLTDADFGAYLCYGENRLGQDYQMAQLTELKKYNPTTRAPKIPSTNNNWGSNKDRTDFRPHESLTSSRSRNPSSKVASSLHSDTVTQHIILLSTSSLFFTIRTLVHSVL